MSPRVSLWGLSALSRLAHDPVMRIRLASNGAVEVVLKVLNKQGKDRDVARCGCLCLRVLIKNAQSAAELLRGGILNTSKS